MKKASISILLILICYLGYGQTYPLQQNVGNTPTTKVKTNALEGKIIITAFTDTSAANSEGYLKNYDGAVIKTTTPINALWYRVLDSAKWVQILPTGGGTGGIRAWLDGGNYNVLADGQGNAVFGTLGKNGIKFTTQAIPRFILDSAGILSETGSTIGIGYDPSNGNRLTQYSGGGSGNYLDSFWRVPGIDSNYYRINGVTYAVLDSTGGGGGGYGLDTTAWHKTGNSGTDPSTNFIGTTDNNDLVFKRNGIESGRIGEANTSFGLNSLFSNTTGDENSAVGVSALFSNTTGARNSAVGGDALLSNTTGNDNSAVGVNALASNTTGNDNSAVGLSALAVNTTGDGNIALGNYSGYYNLTVSNQFFLNNQNRGSYHDDTSKSLIYGVFDASTNNQSLRLNAKRIYLPYLDNGVGTKAVRWSATQGLVLADTTNSGSGVTSFSKTDNWGITSSVTNPTTTPNHTVGVDSSVVASKDWVGDRLDDYLNITTPRTAWQVFGNHTSGSAAPTWGKLNVNSIDATGTPGSGNFLRGDGSWTAGALSPWQYTGSDIYYNSGNVGVGATSPASKLTVQTNGIGATASLNSGIHLINETAASSGNQQYSPSLVFEGQGWKTNATAASVPVRWEVYNETNQGAAVPGGQLTFRYREGGGAPTTVLILRSNNTSNGVTINGALNGGNITGTVISGAIFSAYGTSGITNVFNWSATYAIPLGETRRAFYTAANNTGSGTLVGFENANGVNRFNSTSGSTVIGGTTPDASSKLEVQSTTQGFLPPKMTATQAEAIVSPAEGLMIYSTDGSGSTITSKGWWGYDGTTWVKLN